jgi:hypothetical protein
MKLVNAKKSVAKIALLLQLFFAYKFTKIRNFNTLILYKKKRLHKK